jgi:hypothetical protein
LEEEMERTLIQQEELKAQEMYKEIKSKEKWLEIVDEECEKLKKLKELKITGSKE